MKSKLVWLLATVMGTCVPAGVMFAEPADDAITIRAGTLPYVRTTDERFQSFQIGFSHLTGGETWKAFDALGGKPGAGANDAALVAYAGRQVLPQTGESVLINRMGWPSAAAQPSPLAIRW